MNKEPERFKSGLPGLDAALGGLIAGDNVVWEVDGIEDYLPFVTPFCAEARRHGRKLVYFRFADHAPLVTKEEGAEIYCLEPEKGFEKFLTEILDVIERSGLGAYYVFDCLSDLAADWFSDRMLGNFFLITCPYLYQMETVTYFALIKNRHSNNATISIDKTAQVILEVFRRNHEYFIHPLKVYARYSPTLYMLHRWEGEQFTPVTSSAITTEILSRVYHPWLEFSIYRPGVWIRTFREAQEVLEDIRRGTRPDSDGDSHFQRLLNMVVTRDERFGGLARKYFTLEDLIAIMQRMIGTGLIGGKSLGMLLARAILKRSNPRWVNTLEAHDSFFIGSDVFYTYLVENDCWWLRRRHKDFDAYLDRAEQAREKILHGEFPAYIRDQFEEMLEYFGQSPIIVRSSSLLEDNYGNAFSGKYDSVFCANQGTPQERLEAFMNAVRHVYASTMSREGLLYRRDRNLLDQDEQMALLVQRVSGQMFGRFFYPHMAGVGFSYNPFVWNEEIDSHAGVLRLVFGLGTRAVDRTADDYARMVALNAPLKRPETLPEEIRQYTQRRVDVLDLKGNQFGTRDFESAARAMPIKELETFASCDQEMLQRMKSRDIRDAFSYVIDLDRVLGETPFAADMRELMATLQAAYDYPVDIEFTANFLPDGSYRINLLQCRPFQVKIKVEGSRVRFPSTVARDRLVLETRGPIVGHSLATVVDRLIYVVPSVYSQMSMSQRYTIARTIGRLTHLQGPNKPETIMLVGPGRWGTSMPSLGVPVQFAEINTVSVMCELALMHEGLVPDISLGTHFFNDLVEMDMLYLAVAPGKEGNLFNEAIIKQQPNRLAELLPGAAECAPALWVIDSVDRAKNLKLHLNVDSPAQRGICYYD